MELLAIADRRVAELNEEIRMLEKQVTIKNASLENGAFLRSFAVEDTPFHFISFTRNVQAVVTKNFRFVRISRNQNT